MAKTNKVKSIYFMLCVTRCADIYVSFTYNFLSEPSLYLTEPMMWNWLK